MAIRYDVSVNWYTSPRIITVAAPSLEITIQDLVDTCRYLEEQFSNMAYPHLVNAAGKEDLGGGVNVGITVTLQNAVLQFESRPCVLTTGTATENDAKGITLTAAGSPNGEFLTLGVESGMTVFNATNAGMATIIAVDSEDQLTSQPLKNCAAATWTVGDTYFIYNSVIANVTGGNLVAVDENDTSIDPMFQSPNVNYVRTSSSSATLSNQEALQFGVYSGQVVIDILNGVSGTEFPTGTYQQPSNNVADALTIANTIGVETLHIQGPLVIPTGTDLSGFHMNGDGANKTILTVDASANVANTEFTNMYLQGDLDETVIIRESVLGDGLSNVAGFVFQCGIEDTIYPHPTLPLHIMSSYSLVPGTAHPHIDLAGVSSLIGIRDYVGGLGFENADSNPTISVDMSSGTIHIHESCTSGLFNCRGVSILNDNTTGSPRPVVLQDGVVNKVVIADAVWDEDLSEHTNVGSAGDTVTDIDLNLEHLSKFSTNRSYIDAAAKTLTIYDDDGLTPLAVFDLLDSTATPSVTSIFERNPKGSP